MLGTRHIAAMYLQVTEHRLHTVFLWVYEELDMPSTSNAEGQLQVSLLLLCTALQRQLDKQSYFCNLTLNRKIL